MTDPARPHLGAVLQRYTAAHLLTVGSGPHPHAAPVTVHPTDDGLRVDGVGRTGRANARRAGAVTLLWAPPQPGGYSLIVDGRIVDDSLLPGREDGAAPRTDLLVRPTRAVLHRPARADTTPSGDGCGADCVEIPVGG